MPYYDEIVMIRFGLGRWGTDSASSVRRRAGQRSVVRLPGWLRWRKV